MKAGFQIYLNDARHASEKRKKMKIAIVGAGKLGLKVAEALLGGDHSVTIIDQDDELLQKLSSHLDVMTVNANAK